MSSSKNLEFEKTSFLNKSNSAFIEQMYLKFINKDPNLPESWANYFEGIGEEIKVIASEINGPSWGPSKLKIDIDELQKKIEIDENNKVNNEKLDTSDSEPALLSLYVAPCDSQQSSIKNKSFSLATSIMISLIALNPKQ